MAENAAKSLISRRVSPGISGGSQVTLADLARKLLVDSGTLQGALRALTDVED